MTLRQGAPSEDITFDVCVVGSGPAGLAAALSCEADGLSTVILEAGGLRPDTKRSSQWLHVNDSAVHASLDVATRECLGGTSWAWGGLCVPFEPVDFEPHSEMPEWPIRYEDIAPWYREAAHFLDCGEAFQSTEHPMLADQADLLTKVGRLARRPWLGRVYSERLKASANLTVCLNAPVSNLICNADGQSIVGVEVKGEDGRPTQVKAQRYILACGGLRSTKLLLVLGRDWPRLFANGAAPLGRYYMGHVTGEIATLVFNDPREAERFFYLKDEDGTRYQRRLHLSSALQDADQLLDTAFTIRSPRPEDSRHQDGVASLMMLLSSPGLVRRLIRSDRLRAATDEFGWSDVPAHLKNIISEPLALWGKGIAAALQTPGRNFPLIIPNRSGRYSLRYHSEQKPHSDSRVYLSSQVGANDPEEMTVDFRFTEEDLGSIVRSHELLDDVLRRSGKGHLEYHDADPAQRVDAVRAQASDGYHQVGTTRMGADPANSVVDGNCCVHGLSNLFVASSSIFPRTGSANPTFPTVAFALRLGRHVADLANRDRNPPSSIPSKVVHV